MTKYIDKNIVEEILRNLWKKDDGTNSEYRIYYNKALQEVQCEIDSLEVKKIQEESTNNELKIESYWENKYKEVLKQFKSKEE